MKLVFQLTRSPDDISLHDEKYRKGARRNKGLYFLELDSDSAQDPASGIFTDSPC